MQARELFDKFVRLYNMDLPKSDYPTDEDYQNHCMSMEHELHRIKVELHSRGYDIKFIELNDDGYQFELV